MYHTAVQQQQCVREMYSSATKYFEVVLYSIMLNIYYFFLKKTRTRLYLLSILQSEEKMPKHLGGIKGCKYKTSSWHLNILTGSPMVVTLGQQYNVGEKSTVKLYTYINRRAGTLLSNYVIRCSISGTSLYHVLCRSTKVPL